MRNFFFNRYRSHKTYLAKLAAAAGVAAALVAGTAQANSITISNPSFELNHPRPTPGFGSITQASPWLGTGFWQGNASYANRAHTGDSSGFMNLGQTITQTLTTNFAQGEYTLNGWMTWVAAGNVAGLDVTASLVNADTSFVLGSITSSPNLSLNYSQMTPLVVDLPLGDPNIGHPIEIVFTGVGSAASSLHRTIDDISLDFVPVPEPGSLVLLGMGAAGLGLMARRRFGNANRKS